jgi:quinol-cytochrome oxidoreductase complex cytochrome b subunit
VASSRKIDVARAEGTTMKAFLAAVVVAVLLAIGAAYALDWLDRSSANVYQTDRGNVRL